LLRSTLKIGLASAIMGGAIALASTGIQGWLGVSRLARLAELAISIPLGVAVFGTACRILRVAELETAGRALIEPLVRWRAARA
jgi:hypothetical protein